MTSLTGSVPLTHSTTISPPPFAAAVIGGLIQISVVVYIWWRFTSAKECLEDMSGCLIRFSSSDPFGRLVVMLMLSTVVVFAVSVVNGFHQGKYRTADPSIVDRLWSLAPIVYVWYLFFSYHTSLNHRLLFMCVGVTLWGSRLTYNFYIKGGFSHGEDHRWPVVRGWYPGWRFELFNIIFICFFQMLAIFSFVSPAVVVAQNNHIPWNVYDTVTASVFLLLWLGETIADKQMFDFQTRKYELLSKSNGDLTQLPEPYKAGFIQSGLWAYSRHPNYFCEVSMWWIFYLFSVIASNDGNFINWSLNGAVFLSMLFLLPTASVDVSEYLSSKKYAEYKDYQRRVSKFIPFFPSSSSKSKSH